ncbi:hypothetical protein GEMRC1_012737 [Eukaryota sp. GEM-RC1]
MFVKKHEQRLRSIKSTDNNGIKVTPEIFEILSSFNVDSVFLAKCLCNSWQNLKSDWTMSQFDSCLKSITCTLKTVNVISETLSDLLDDVDIEPLLSRFLLLMVPLQIQSSTATLTADVAKLRTELVGAKKNLTDEVLNLKNENSKLFQKIQSITTLNNELHVKEKSSSQQILNLETDNRSLREEIERLKSNPANNEICENSIATPLSRSSQGLIPKPKNKFSQLLAKKRDNSTVVLSQVLEEMRNGSVTKIDLKYYSIGNEGAIALAEALKVNSTVTEIYLMNNSIGNEGAIALADALKVNSTVTQIILWSNSIDSETEQLIKRISNNRISCEFSIVNFLCFD